MPAPEKITHLILHCTAAPWGTVESVDAFHRAKPPLGRGWAAIGYAYLVTNPFPTFRSWKEKQPLFEHDGLIHKGRDLDGDGNVDEEVGAHTAGWNGRSIGIAYVGEGGHITGEQLRSLLRLCRQKCDEFEVPFKHVIGHYETGSNKTCPDIDMEHFRNLMESL